MLVGLPSADDVNGPLVRSGVDNPVYCGLNAPERDIAKLLTIVDHLEDFILEDQGGPQERNLVVPDVGGVLIFPPREL
jgi:hypothetical protein